MIRKLGVDPDRPLDPTRWDLAKLEAIPPCPDHLLFPGRTVSYWSSDNFQTPNTYQAIAQTPNRLPYLDVSPLRGRRPVYASLAITAAPGTLLDFQSSFEDGGPPFGGQPEPEEPSALESMGHTPNTTSMLGNETSLQQVMSKAQERAAEQDEQLRLEVRALLYYVKLVGVAVRDIATPRNTCRCLQVCK